MENGQIHEFTLNQETDKRNDGLLDGLAELSLRDLLHLAEDHGRDLLRGEGLLLIEVVNLDQGRAVVINDLERPVGAILLDVRVTTQH
jgi:hypothetical protein